MNEQTEAALNAIGALAEQLAFFRDRLEEHGFDIDEAFTLCRDMMKTMLGGNHADQ